LRRWRPQDARGSRAAAACGVVLITGCAALGAFVLWAPASSWAHPELIAALAAIAVLAYLAEHRLKLNAAAYFDASIMLAVLALAIGGPVPALLVWLIPDVSARFIARLDPIASPGHVSTVASFALAILAGAGVLALAAPPSAAATIPALVTAGLVMWTVNFAVARLLFAPAYQGYRVRELVRSEFVDMAPAVFAMLCVAVATWALLEPLGVFALALLASIILLPQLAITVLARHRSITRLLPAQATQIYAEAIADQLRLSRLERRLLVESQGAAEPTGKPERRDGRARRHQLTGMVLLGLDERWDGHGRPFAIPSAHTLRVSRVLAVARAWSELTAAGSPGLSQTEAMLALELRSGSEFDPEVVQAAGEVVAAEQGFLREPDFEPRLHRLPFPRPMRRGTIPALLARLANPAGA
jgi:hypothetical protein